MSFHISDEELKAHASKGARVVGGAPAKPVVPAPPPPEDPLVKEMRALASAVAVALNRPHPSAPPAPVIHVAAPKVNVIANKTFKRLKFEVTERDNTADHAIKTLIVTQEE